MADLTGLRVLIVGGSAGIGFACAKRMLDDGVAAITIVGRRAENAAAAAASLGDRVSAVIGDGGRPADASRIVSQAVQEMGGLDVLLCSAAGDPTPKLLTAIPLHELMDHINGPLAPAVTIAHAAYSHMIEQGSGSIILLASDAGKLATPGEAAIGAAMAAIAMFARTMAIEGKRRGVRANCITPSIVRGTPLYDRLMAEPFASRLFKKAEEAAQLGVAEPDDIARLASFLASTESSRITGQTISVTGGVSAI